MVESGGAHVEPRLNSLKRVAIGESLAGRRSDRACALRQALVTIGGPAASDPDPIVEKLERENAKSTLDLGVVLLVG